MKYNWYQKLARPLMIWLLWWGGASCSSHNTPDVSNIPMNIESRRLDKDLLQIDTNDIAGGLKQLKQKYPDFLDFYLDTLLGFGIHGDYSNTNPAVSEGFRGFIAQGDYRGLLDTIQAHFPDTQKEDEQIKKSFQYYKYYFPKVTAPKLVYFSSGLNNWGAITVGAIQGVGLDMYLGKNYKYYGSVGLAPYLYTKFTPKFIPVAVMSNQYELLVPFVYDDRNLLDLMIQRGKQQYFLEHTVPYLKDYERLGYTQEQWQWCENNAQEIYAYFIQNKLLYETNLQRIMRYVVDGPTSTGMPAESPGNIGTWLGYQIVKHYAKAHSDKDLASLLIPIPAEQFLRESGYKP